MSTLRSITTYYLLLTTFYLLPTTYSLLLTTYYLLLTTNYLLPTTYYLLLTTYYLQVAELRKDIGSPEAGWKTVFRPEAVAQTFDSVDAHGWFNNNNMFLLPPHIAYIRHVRGDPWGTHGWTPHADGSDDAKSCTG